MSDNERRPQRGIRNTVIAGFLILSGIVVAILWAVPPGSPTSPGTGAASQRSSSGPTVPVTVDEWHPETSSHIDTTRSIPAAALLRATEPHRVVETKITDSPERRQVQLAVVLAEIPSREDIERLLFRLEAVCENFYEFRFITHVYGETKPTHIWIDLYASHDHLITQNGLTAIARFSRTPKDLRDPESYNFNMTIQDQHLADLTGTPEERFGYTREQRMAIHREVRAAEKRAQEMADARYPVHEFNFATREQHHAQFSRNHDYSTDLQVQARAEIAVKYVLSERGLHAIIGEGMTKGWPE